jgi:superfamily II DNA or RNA helicase
MNHFRSAVGSIHLRPIVDDKPGLRNSQIGAVHSIGAHFSLRDDPALVVLPTGAGKTAVLMISPYVLLSERVLIITPSRFVRDQISTDFAKLKTLKAVGAIDLDIAPPMVIQNREQVRTQEGWESFRSADVVISTPNGASPSIKGIPEPPSDLFDLVLVDEAHHSPAPTWNALIASFSRARVVLFTATPFRRDRREIKAKYLYTYPIQRAFDDGIYGEMTYVPVAPNAGQSIDEAIAIQTERIMAEDKARGLDHRLMVRADSRPRAANLFEVYERTTKLKLKMVDSSQSKRTVDNAVELLRKGDIDGVICVDMLGEGFDLPRLKIAALHAPHRSLAVTLQFLGRFARVKGDGLGDAKFLAVPSEMEGELSTLFEESEAWGRKVRLLGQERIGAEVRIKEFLEHFEDEEVSNGEALEQDISLYSFVVFNHVKIHEVFGVTDLRSEIVVPGFNTERVWVNEEDATIVALFREVVRPKWATTPGLDRVEHHLVVVYWDEAAHLLFVCSSLREEVFYKAIVSSLVRGVFKTLSLNKTNRVLRAFDELELFNVGIRNRATGTVAESYRQIVGSSADHALDKGDAALYHRGHLFGRGTTPTGVNTIGVSSLGKVWRLEPTKIPELVEWLRLLARDIENPAPFTTGIAIDYFDSGIDVTEIPDSDILTADWSEAVYKHPWMVTIERGQSAERSVSILDFDLKVSALSPDRKSVVVTLENGAFSTKWSYGIDPVPTLQYADANQPRIWSARNFGQKDVLEYMAEDSVFFYLADGSMLKGAELFPPMGDDAIPFDVARCATPIDWDEANVDIQVEFGPCAPKHCIHDWLGSYLTNSVSEIVVYDHRAGECADYIAIGLDTDQRIAIDFYHCKASGGPRPGDRVADAYEVCGQAIKSAKFRNRRQLVKHLRDRLAGGSRLVKGNTDVLLDLLGGDPRYELPLRVHMVQPGISQERLTPKIGGLLAAVNRALVSVGCKSVGLICSK